MDWQQHYRARDQGDADILAAWRDLTHTEDDSIGARHRPSGAAWVLRVSSRSPINAQELVRTKIAPAISSAISTIHTQPRVALPCSSGTRAAK